MDAWWDWLQTLQWERLLPELIGKALGVLAGVTVTWWVLFRKRLRQLDRLRKGDSDEVLYQAHLLLPVDAIGEASESQVQLIFRNVAPRRTIDEIYDNLAARETLRGLCQQTTLNNPILQTEGREGFEILNDAMGVLAGYQAVSPLPRQVWLFCITCEDRDVVRKECVRCFLFRPDDLAKFADWNWCRKSVRVERPWHWLRVVTVHRIARYYHDEQLALPQTADGTVPLVDDQRQHRRVLTMSLGINEQEVATAPPFRVDWSDKEAELSRRGVLLVGDR